MRRLLVLPLVAVLCAAAPPPPSPAAAHLAHLRSGFEARHAALSAQLEKLRAELDDLEEARLTRLVDLVKAHPKDPGVFPALETLLVDATPHAALALETITAHHLDHSRLGRLCLFLIEADEGLGSKTEALTRAAFARSPHRHVRAHAGLALARLLLARESPADRREAETVLTTLLAKYPAVRMPAGDDDETVGSVVRPMLFDVQNLAIGRPAPDLRGVGDDGKPLALADYRGRVVVLVFWSAGSGASAELFPRLRALPKAVVVGVADDEVEVPKAMRPPWRSFRDGGRIASAWNLRSWPTVYVIDADGVIRGRWAGKPDSTLEALAGGKR